MPGQLNFRPGEKPDRALPGSRDDEKDTEGHVSAGVIAEPDPQDSRGPLPEPADQEADEPQPDTDA